MICRFCPAGRRHTRNGYRCVNCLLYGMVMRENHECTREGWKDYAGYDDHGEESRDGAEIPEDRGRIIEMLPGILSETGEREGIPGMEE